MAAAAAEVALVKSGNPITKFSREPPPLRDHLRVSAASRPSSAEPKKKSGKTEINETLLTRRFYTTDFDEMEQLFNTEINGNPNQAEFEALIDEFKTDYNQTHFVRNPEFTEAADRMRGPLRMVFVAFLERSCTAEFSGFLLYKELGRRLKIESRKPTLWWPRSSPSCREMKPGMLDSTCGFTEGKVKRLKRNLES